MKKVFFALIFSLFFVFPSRAEDDLEAYKKECLQFISKPEIELLFSYGKLRYKFDKDEAYLRRKTSQKYRDSEVDMDDNYTPLGLTEAKHIFDLNLTTGVLNLGHGYSCVFPQSIKARLEYHQPTIYILNTLEKGSCLYDLTLRHEKTHMQIYIDALDYFLPTFKKYMKEQYDNIGIKIIRSDEPIENAARALSDSYSSSLQKRVEDWNKAVEAEQFKLDTPEHYILENKICEEIDGKKEQY